MPTYPLNLPKMVTWWRLDGSAVDMVVPEGGDWYIMDGGVYFRDGDRHVVSLIVLAPGEAAMRWEGPEGTDRRDYYRGPERRRTR